MGGTSRTTSRPRGGGARGRRESRAIPRGGVRGAGRRPSRALSATASARGSPCIPRAATRAPLEGFAGGLIRRKAARLVGRAAFTRLVIDHAAADLLRRRKASKRDPGTVVSLHAPVRSQEGEWEELADRIDRGGRSGERRPPTDGATGTDLRIVLAELLGRLPDDLRDLAGGLMHHNGSELARRRSHPGSCGRRRPPGDSPPGHSLPLSDSSPRFSIAKRCPKRSRCQSRTAVWVVITTARSFPVGLRAIAFTMPPADRSVATGW